jgi:hypothetical protein
MCILALSRTVHDPGKIYPAIKAFKTKVINESVVFFVSLSSNKTKTFSKWRSGGN